MKVRWVTPLGDEIASTSYRSSTPSTPSLLTRDDARRGQRAAYSLTEAGIQVLPVMVALGNWGLAHRHGEHRVRVRAELLRDGDPELVTAMIDELRELHLGVRRPNPDAPRASDQLRAAYEAAVCDRSCSARVGVRGSSLACCLCR